MITTNVKTGWVEALWLHKGTKDLWSAYNSLFLNIDDGYMGVLYVSYSLLYTGYI